MKNIELLQLQEVLGYYREQLNPLKGVKFAFTLSKNIDIINDEAKFILEKRELTKEYQEFEKTRISICEVFADKNEDGTVKTTVNAVGATEYALDQTNPIFIERIKELKTKFESAIDTQQKLNDEFNALLQEEYEVEFAKVNIADVPAEISVELFNVVKFMIEN